MKSRRSPNNDLETIMPLLIGIWRRLHKEPGPSDKLQTREFRGVVANVKTLVEGLENKKELIGQDYFAKPELLTSYLLYQWVVHYQQGMSLMGELPYTPRRVLDVCSGPAAFAFAALRHGSSEVFAVDRNIAALELGSQICGRYGLPINIRKWDCFREPLPVEGKFDLIILGHCLEELFPADKKGWVDQQEMFVNNLLKRLTPRGFLMIVENSFIEPNRRVLQMRDSLVQQGVPVQAPCVWKGECPALKTQNSPCYAQREFEKPMLIKEIQRAANINLSSLKMTYMIFRNPDGQWPQLQDEKLYRIISPPVESYQGKRYYLCGTDGKKILGSHLSKHPAASRAFEFLRRGELISFKHALEKDNALEIVKDTEISIKAACGKPLEEEDCS